MKKLISLLLLAAIGVPALAQQAFRYTIWADGVLNAQLAKSNLYGAGAGLRGEISRLFRNSSGGLFAQAGYTHFFEKNAFTANVSLVNIGYRYQSRRAFNASLGLGVQYWREQMRVQFPDASINEIFNNLIPSTTVGIGMRFRPRYRVGLENRLLLKPETGSVQIRNNVALSFGYSF